MLKKASNRIIVQNTHCHSQFRIDHEEEVSPTELEDIVF